MELTLRQLADLTRSKVSGDENQRISGVATVEQAGPGQISFISNPRYRSMIDKTRASAVVISPDLATTFTGNALIHVDPYLTFARIVEAFHPVQAVNEFRHPSAVIAENVQIGANCSIGAHVVIESGTRIGNSVNIGAGCYIGRNCLIAEQSILNPNVTLYSDTKVGERAILHSGAVIGADGFGFAQDKELAHKPWFKIHQIGNVVLGRDVEIGANTTIDRAALGTTMIGDGVKLDNQIQIGHNVSIDEHTVIAGGTGIAGSTHIGKHCQIGGAVGIAGHLTIADDVVITGKSMVINSINKPGVYSSGIPTDDNAKWRRNAARFRQLDAMARQIKQLEKRLNELVEK